MYNINLIVTTNVTHDRTANYSESDIVHKPLTVFNTFKRLNQIQAVEIKRKEKKSRGIYE